MTGKWITLKQRAGGIRVTVVIVQSTFDLIAVWKSHAFYKPTRGSVEPVLGLGKKPLGGVNYLEPKGRYFTEVIYQ